MDKEEAKAIDILQNCIADYVIGDYCTGEHCHIEDCKECIFEEVIYTVVNLVKRQEKTIEKLKHHNKQIKQKEKMIDKMANYLADEDIDETICKYIDCKADTEEINCTDCIKQYFKRIIGG